KIVPGGTLHRVHFERHGIGFCGKFFAWKTGLLEILTLLQLRSPKGIFGSARSIARPKRRSQSFTRRKTLSRSRHPWQATSCNGRGRGRSSTSIARSYGSPSEQSDLD